MTEAVIIKVIESVSLVLPSRKRGVRMPEKLEFPWEREMPHKCTTRNGG